MAYKKRVRFSNAIAKKILLNIEAKMTITKVCELPDMPDRRSIHRWRHQYPEFDINFKRSEAIRLSFLVDEMIELSDMDVINYLTKRDNEQPDKTKIWAETSRIRLRVDVIKFLSANLYGAKRHDNQSSRPDNVVNVVNYTPAAQGITNKPATKHVQDLQPSHLKNYVMLTPAQQAQQTQQDLLKP